MMMMRHYKACQYYFVCFSVAWSDGWWLEELSKYGINQVESTIKVRAMFSTSPMKPQPLAVQEIVGANGEYIGGDQVRGILNSDPSNYQLGRVLDDEISIEFPLRPDTNIYPYGQ